MVRPIRQAPGLCVKLRRARQGRQPFIAFSPEQRKLARDHHERKVV